ncbi:MAG TPA: signal peptidase I [Allosphingosinicella sp.]|nr:signal peptidase I [Allosphingosinicella sp.]
MSPTFRRVLWRTIVGIAAAIALLFVALIVAFGSGYVRNFHIPSEGMAPTLEKGDRLVAFMDGGTDLRRGDVVLLRVGESTYVQRIAGLPGDTIGMRGGVVVLNGRPVAQRLLARERRAESSGASLARRLAEQLPGEATPHEILDMGPSQFDEFPEQRIPAGFVFTLGDNRDRSADGRVPREEMGVEMLPLGDVQGKPLFCLKGCDLRR